MTAEAIGDFVESAAIAALLTSTIVNLAMTGALAQVWGMINGMQLVIHFPVFKVTLPDRLNMFIETLISVATFDIPYLNIDSIDTQN